jgi:hypothetical protein
VCIRLTHALPTSRCAAWLCVCSTLQARNMNYAPVMLVALLVFALAAWCVSLALRLISLPAAAASTSSFACLARQATITCYGCPAAAMCQ